MNESDSPEKQETPANPLAKYEEYLACLHKVFGEQGITVEHAAPEPGKKTVQVHHGAEAQRLEARGSPGSTRVARVGFGVLAETNFLCAFNVGKNSAP